MRRPVFSSLTFLVIAGICAGCATVRHEASVPRLAPEQRKVVFVADGAGDYRLASANIRETAEEDKLPLAVETFVWSHGAHRVLIDQMDCDNTHTQGQRLAELVRATHEAYPDRSISLVGHSAGCYVVLAAAEELPPGSIDRIVMLNPSVPANYDLRRALKTCCGGIDVHCSTADRFYLGVLVELLSACKGIFVPPAGLAGFRLHPDNEDDSALFARVHNFPWRPELLSTGNNGGHYGAYQHGYLRGYILPALVGQQQ